MEIIIVVVLIAIFLFWNSGNKVTKTFFQAIENAQEEVLSNPSKALKLFYTHLNNSRKSEVETLGIDYVIKTSTIEENRIATETIMAYLVATLVRNTYKYQSDEDVFKMLKENSKIKKKFDEAVSTTSMFTRRI